MENKPKLQEDLLKVPEVAHHLRIPLSRWYDLINRGAIPGVIRIGPHSIRVSRKVLEEWERQGCGLTDSEAIS